jgi:hypothetical protein
MNATKVLVFLALWAAVWWLASTVIRLENYRYASVVGVCYEPADYTQDTNARERRDECLTRTVSRTNGVWHLGYALGIM